MKTERELKDALENVLDTLRFGDAEDLEESAEPLYNAIRDIDNLRDSGYLTSDEGLVIKLKNGSVFILTIRKVH